jgi:hypothetical protein
MRIIAGEISETKTWLSEIDKIDEAVTRLIGGKKEM